MYSLLLLRPWAASSTNGVVGALTSSFIWNVLLEEAAVLRQVGREEWEEEGGGGEASEARKRLLKGLSQRGQPRPALASGLQPGGNSEISSDCCWGLLAWLPLPEPACMGWIQSRFLPPRGQPAALVASPSLMAGPGSDSTGK